MDSELAKQLKDAGFPQSGRSRLAYNDRGELWEGAGGTYCPILEELIEACGKQFLNVNRYAFSSVRIEWEANATTDNGYFHGEGLSPTEAVARLWLALNAPHETTG